MVVYIYILYSWCQWLVGLARPHRTIRPGAPDNYSGIYHISTHRSTEYASNPKRGVLGVGSMGIWELGNGYLGVGKLVMGSLEMGIRELGKESYRSWEYGYLGVGIGQ